MVFWSKLLRKMLFSRPEFTTLMNEYIDEKYESTIVVYNIHSERYRDVRKAFVVTSRQKAEMKQYFTELVEGIDNMDSKALIVAKHITERMKYTGDEKNFGKPEYWADPYTTFTTWKGDCEDDAILICYAWGLIGIPRFRRFVFAGDVFKPDGTYDGGHAYAVYMKERDMELYPLEGSYYPVETWDRYTNGKPLRTNNRYGKLWFATNEEKSYRGDRFR